MKHIIILGDGMADWPVPELGGKTLLQYADTPNMDKIARMGCSGLLQTVPEGFHPGSEVANSAILGFDQHKVYEGRGPLEAASIGVELADDDLAMRCNLICIEDGKIKNHSCGRLETEEADVLIRFLDEKLGSERVHFYTGVQYRHLLVIKGGNKHLKCTPPHDVPGTPFADCMVQPEIPEAQETADLLNSLILKSQELLAGHPLNKAELLFEKIEDNVIEAQVQKLLDTKKANEAANYKANPVKPTVSFEDFEKLDIRVGTVLECENVPKMKKLLKFKIADGLENRIIVSGIAQHYKPEELVGKQVLFIANLAPRQFKTGLVSEGMILSAENFDGSLAVTSLLNEVKPGSEVK